MGSIIFNVDTTVAFYFSNHDRNALNTLIQNHGTVLDAANAQNPEVPVQLVVDIITNAANIQDPQPITISTGKPKLEFSFTGFLDTIRTYRYTCPVDLKKIQTAFLSTDVKFTDSQVPIQDENLNNMTAVPPDENNVAGKANDE